MFAIDSNVLVYAAVATDPRKHAIALELMLAAPLLDFVIPTQVLGEFLNVMRRKHPADTERVLAQARRWSEILPMVSSSAEDMVNAAIFAQRYRLQFWDSLIWQVACGSGAELFFSEDLQDGLSIEGMTVVNPFASVNAPLLKALLAQVPRTI